jgi:hypothetical protein
MAFPGRLGERLIQADIPFAQGAYHPLMGRGQRAVTRRCRSGGFLENSAVAMRAANGERTATQ